MQRFFVVVVFVFVQHLLAAQTVLKTTHDSAQQHPVPVRVLVSGHQANQRVEYVGNPLADDSVAHAVKLDVLLLTRGDFSIFYEHRLHDAWSVEGGLGLTWIDYLYELGTNNFKLLGDEKNNVRFRSGTSLRLHVRWYPSRYSTAVSGWYMDAGVARRNYRTDYYANTGLIRIPFSLNRTWMDYTLNVGFQQADRFDTFFWDCFFGLGTRYVDEYRLKNVGINAEREHVVGWQPMATLGFRFVMGL